MQSILLTGASSELMQQTIKGMDDFTFKGISRQNRTHDTIQYVQGNLNDPFSLAEAVEGVSMVIHAAALTHSNSSTDYFKVNVEGTLNLIKVAESAGVQKMVYISSRTAGLRNGAYAESKLMAEELVKSRMPEWLIIRPAEIFGGSTTEGINQLIEDIRSKSWVICPVNLSHKLYPIHLYDAARIISKHIFELESRSQVVTVNGREAFSFFELIQYISGALEKKINIIPIPRFLMFTIMYALQITGIRTSIVLDQIPRLYGAKSMQEPEGELISLSKYLKG